MKDSSYSGSTLEQALKNKELGACSSEFTALVQASDTAGYVCLALGGCDNWVEMPSDMIEQAASVGQFTCKDHTHPVMKIRLKDSGNPEAAVLLALLLQALKRSQAQPQSYGGAPASGYTAGAAGQAYAGAPATPPANGIGSEGPPGQGPRQGVGGGGGGNPAASARLNLGNFGGLGGFGGLSAWGCWTPSCCAAGHYEAGPTGWQWVCDWWVDCPYERCIWPW